MRKRVSEIIAATLLCACLALAGTAALAVAGLLGDGPTAQAQESSGEGQAGADADGGGEGQAAEDGVEGQDDVYVLCDGGDSVQSVPAGSTQSVTCEVANDTSYNISLRVTTTGGVHKLGDPTLGSKRPDRTYRTTVRVRVDSAGSFTLHAADHQDSDEDTVRYTVTSPTPTDTPDTPTPTTPAPTLSAPPAPSNFRVTSTGLTSARLAWSAQSNISRFQLSVGSQTHHPTRSSSSFTVTGLTCGTAYTFSIRAEGDDTNTKGWSAWSSTTGTTSACPEPTVAPTPDPTPVDNAPTFGSSSISNKIWKQNTRIPSFTLPRATGGDGTLTYSLSRGQPAGVRALPAGVSRSGRTVSGTPSGTMTRTKYTWTATDSDRTDPDSATLTFYITVNADLAPAFGTTTTISDKAWTHNKAITNFTLPRATGGDGTLTYSLSRSGQSSGASALPAGVSRSARSVSGTPSALLANTTFTWTATDSDGDKASLTFKIEVLPQVSIAAKKAEVAEGQRAEFTLTASAAPLANLAVTVRVTQSGTFISGTAPTSATISAGQTTATLSVPTTKDSVDEADGSVRAEVRTGTGYAVGSAASASVSVRDTPRISIAAGTSPVTEGANATFTITAAGAPLSSIVIPVSVTQSGAFIKGTAPTRVTIAANGTSATLTVATENDATDEQNGSITAALSGNAASPYVIVSGSSSASVTVNDNDVKLATPANFTLTPLPQRKARLDWPMVTGAPKYRIEITGGGASGAFILTHNNAPAVSSEINLDSILNGKGLAHANAYQFKVKAIYDTDNSDASDPYVDSDFSSVVEIRDTLIISINGDSSGRTDGNGQAVVTWSAVPGATSYTLRWRKMARYRWVDGGYGYSVSALVPHSNTNWRPQAASNDTDWNYPTGTSFSGMTIGGLDLGEIYAFQLNYTLANGQGYSVREAYVWPSTDFPSDRVATYPFYGHWPNKTYSYTICNRTFPPDTAAKWVTLIERAFNAWNTPTMITMERSRERCIADTDVPISTISSLNNSVNEVFMVDTTDKKYLPFVGHIVNVVYDIRQLLNPRTFHRYTIEFDWFGNINEVLPSCVFNAPACVISPAYRPFRRPSSNLDGERSLALEGSVDVLIRRTDQSDDLDVPDSVRFNTCIGSNDYGKYELMVHEAAHTIGLSGFSFASLRSDESAFIMSHSTIPLDTVTDYDVVKNKGCSPHPFDIMAVSALYQGVAP